MLLFCLLDVPVNAGLRPQELGSETFCDGVLGVLPHKYDSALASVGIGEQNSEVPRLNGEN